jgi:hypothetical protein
LSGCSPLRSTLEDHHFNGIIQTTKDQVQNDDKKEKENEIHEE